MTAPLATVPDVENRWRPLTEAERAAALTRIDDASALVRAYRRDVDAHLADPDYADMVARIVADVALRVLRNPAGVRQESIGARSYTLDTGSGLLQLTEAEQQQLDLTPDRAAGATGGAFTIAPAYVPDWPPAGRLVDRLDCPVRGW